MQVALHTKMKITSVFVHISKMRTEKLSVHFGSFHQNHIHTSLFLKQTKSNYHGEEKTPNLRKCFLKLQDIVKKNIFESLGNAANGRHFQTNDSLGESNNPNSAD